MRLLIPIQHRTHVSSDHAKMMGYPKTKEEDECASPFRLL